MHVEGNVCDDGGKVNEDGGKVNNDGSKVNDDDEGDVHDSGSRGHVDQQSSELQPSLEKCGLKAQYLASFGPSCRRLQS